jgi:transcriptional regulator with XRE-family HTH domain
MISGNQIRAARGLLNWSAEELAKRTGMARNTVFRLETHDDVPPSRTQSLLQLKRVFEEAGIEFIGEPGNGPGVRLWIRKNQLR